MLNLFIKYLTGFFSSWHCILAVVIVLSISFGILFHREISGIVCMRSDSPFMDCLECGRIRIHFNTLSCRACVFKKIHVFFIRALQTIISLCCIVFIAKLLVTHEALYGIFSVLFLLDFFCLFVIFDLTSCHRSRSTVCFFLSSGLVDNVVIDTDCMSLMIFSENRMVCSAPIRLEKNFSPDGDGMIDVYFAFPGEGRKYAFCCTGIN